MGGRLVIGVEEHSQIISDLGLYGILLVYLGVNIPKILPEAFYGLIRAQHLVLEYVVDLAQGVSFHTLHWRCSLVGVERIYHRGSIMNRRCLRHVFE